MNSLTGTNRTTGTHRTNYTQHDKNLTSSYSN